MNRGLVYYWAPDAAHPLGGRAIRTVRPLPRLEQAFEQPTGLSGRFVVVRNATELVDPEADGPPGSACEQSIGDAEADEFGDFLFEPCRGGGGMGKAGLADAESRRRHIADIFFGNLEGPLARREAKGDRISTYRLNPALARVLSVGESSVVNLANDHLLDRGREGVKETLEALWRHDVKAVGGGVSREAAHQPVVPRAGRYRVGLLGYYWNHGCAAGDDLPGSAVDSPEILASDILSLRPRVDRIVVAFHWASRTTASPRPRIATRPDSPSIAAPTSSVIIPMSFSRSKSIAAAPISIAWAISLMARAIARERESSWGFASRTHAGLFISIPSMSRIATLGSPTSPRCSAGPPASANWASRGRFRGRVGRLSAATTAGGFLSASTTRRQGRLEPLGTRGSPRGETSWRPGPRSDSGRAPGDCDLRLT